MIAQLTAWTVAWASVYSNHAVLRTLVVFAHVGGLVAGGGVAVATDRCVLNTVLKDEWSRKTLLDAVGASHRIVVGAIVLIVISGVLMLAADVDTFLYSRVFWLKMAFFALLLGNGVVLTRAERRALDGDEAAFPTLRGTAIASITLWFLTTLAGVGLLNI
ncbi:MAG TPA: DUF6644 family protein [Vicinamibacterales bacterium]|nr:DUF6644 family protein [Vicinamibacterales bacterium]